MTHWARDAIFYHLFPLGACGVPRRNTLSGTPQHRLNELLPWLDHARNIGATAILLGPVMESGSHGYDVVDYCAVDRRLGDVTTMGEVAREIHGRGLRLVLDGVFNHVGRDFWAFRDVKEKGRQSHYADWFYLDFTRVNSLGDPFSYRSWNGCDDLVKLNTSNSEVRTHLFAAISAWFSDYGVDGLRLDAADHLDMAFVSDLGKHCRSLREDFWLMGEVVKGPYTAWLKDGGLDSVTNYECYKALYSSHNDANYHELAYCLRRHFAEGGLYGEEALYAFADNHDVPRVASLIADPAHLYPLYCLLFTIPGIPSIYYGSEFAARGEKAAENDWPLRPRLDLARLRKNPRSGDLAAAITHLVGLRRDLPALRYGDYTQLALSHRRMVFSRRTEESHLIVAVSAEGETITQGIAVPGVERGRLVDLLNPGQAFIIEEDRATITMWPCWGRIMEVREEP